ncbi:MAG: DUF2029 domain-containing protein [Candidatus Omnitrophica bacterium]|nr:DUF2029 domain-containing protein [Candidatus Omnitrophota bacterium]MCB9721534.1 DUF2029 domain-containing protein [Candidatus Omnitrophota bacterium]
MLRRLRTELIVIGVILCGLWGSVTAMSKGLPKLWCQIIDRATGGLFTSTVMAMENGFYYQVDNNAMPTTAFLVVFFIAFLLVAYLTLRIERSQDDRWMLGAVLAFAVVFRLILLPGEPIHENDYYRYLWDGKATVHGINPYKYAPSDLFMYEYHYSEDYYDDIGGVVLAARTRDKADAARLDRLLALRDANRLFYDRIGHWQVPTIYPPAAQAVFALISWLRPDSFIFMKFVFMLFDLGVIALTVMLLRHCGRNPAMVIIYAWSPLVLKEFPNAGHFDPVAVFFTLLAVYWLVTDRALKGFIALALAALSKFFSVVLLPLFAGAGRRRGIPAFFAVIAFAYVPFLLWNDASFTEIFRGLSTYNQEWSYNSSLFAIIYRVMEEINADWVRTLIPSKVVAAVLYGAGILWLSVRPCAGTVERLHRCLLAVAGLFIINPVGDPWYFCWCIPFLCLFPYRSWILLSGTLILSYLNFQSIYPFVDWNWWGVPVLSYVIYVPFLLVWVWEVWRRPDYLQVR